MKAVVNLLLAVALGGTVSAQTLSWGDQGNGTYINPVLNADYSDPDAIRVGDKYYMVSSEFHFMGMPVLESDDLVNWRTIGRVYDRMDYPEYDNFNRYAGGPWAPAIRYHDGLFYIYFCTPDEGLFMTTAKDPAGPWAPLHLVKGVEKWEDPCPFWDEDGQAYLGRSRHGAGPIIIHKMSPDGKQLLDDGVTVYKGPVAEGTKIHKINGYYYINIPEGGVSKGWQTVLRSKDIYGPYEKKIVLERGSTDINGPHQGALVDTPDGEWWMLHFQKVENLGRVVHLQPVRWIDGWPEMGVDIDRNGVGEPVKVWTKPAVKTVAAIERPASSDEFDSLELGLQWRANHRFDYDNISLGKKKGHLTLTAMKGDSLRVARNTLVQKVMGYGGEVEVKLDASKMAEGQRAGLLGMDKYFHGAGVEKKDGHLYVYADNGGTVETIAPMKGSVLYLKMSLDAVDNVNRLYYSFDGKKYIGIGEPFTLGFGFWKGPHVGVYSYNPEGDGGDAGFDYFRYNYD